jgi:hypothetical protein
VTDGFAGIDVVAESDTMLVVFRWSRDPNVYAIEVEYPTVPESPMTGEPVSSTDEWAEGRILAVHVLLDWLVLIYIRTGDGEGIPLTRQLAGTLVATGLAWLVWRRSQVVWGLLLVWHGGFVLWMAWLASVPWGARVVGLMLVNAVQLAMLLSPAVLHHVRRPAAHPAP